jgi:hypothetical protein
MQNFLATRINVRSGDHPGAHWEQGSTLDIFNPFIQTGEVAKVVIDIMISVGKNMK